MNVNIQTVHFDADQKLISYVSQKISKLPQFHDRIINVDVFLKLDNVVHNIKDKIAEIRVKVPRSEFFVKSTSKSFEASFDEALESMINQIKRKKEKLAA
jgi:putative sigma-54 modulation protein